MPRGLGKQRRHWAGLWAFVLLGLACSDDKASAPAECVVDLALIAEERACAVDDSCPCGSSCSFGQCTATCIEDAECGEGQRCDSFGRCRSAEDDALVRPLRAEPATDLRLSATSMHFAEGDDETRHVGIEHDGDEAVRLRAEGRDRVDVSCDGETFGPSCFIEAAADDTTTVAVRLRDGAGADGVGMVILHPERGDATFVHVSTGDGAALPPVSGAFLASAAGQEPAGPLANGATFRGRAIFEEVGADGFGALPVEGLPSVPLELDLFPAAGTQAFTIREPAAALHPEGGFHGLLSGETLVIPAWRHIAAADLSVPESEVVVQPRVSDLVATPEKISFDLTVLYGGFATARPFYKLRVDLARVGDAPAGLGPDAGTSYVSPFAASRSEVATEWEERANQKCSDGDCEVSEVSRFSCNDDFSLALGFSEGALGVSGDVSCDGGRAMAPDYLLAIDDSTSQTRFGLVEACLGDLGALADGPTGGAEDETAHACLHPLRWFGVVASTIDEVRSVASPAEVPRGVALRNAQQLIETSGFVALEAVQASRYNNALGGDCGAVSCPTLADLPEYLTAAQRVVEPFLHPRYAQYLESLGESQSEVDYATALGAEAYSGPTLSYSMLRASVAQLELLDRAVEGDHVSGSSAPSDGYASVALRKVLLLRAFAAALAVRSNGGAGLDGEAASDYSAQADVFADVFVRAAARIVAVRKGDNPLAIDDDSIPLYLDRDVETPEARAFALTDYLLDPSNSTWIGDAISVAQDSQAAARTAWQDRIEAELAGLAIEADAARYRDRVAREYGKRILALCPVHDPDTGATLAEGEVLDRIASGEVSLDPYSCFINTTDAECAAFATPAAYSESEVLVDLCIAGAMRRTHGTAGFDDPDLGFQAPINASLDAYRRELDSGTVVSSLTKTPDGFSIALGEVAFDLTNEDLQVLTFGVDDTPSAVNAGFGDFNPGQGVSSVQDYDGFAQLTAAQEECERHAERFFGAEPQVAPQAPEALDRAECYRGGLGEAALSTRAAFTEVEASRARLDEHYQRYRIAVNTCSITAATNQAIADETERFNREVEDLQTASTWLNVATKVFGGATGLASGYANRKNRRTKRQKQAGKASTGLGVLTLGLTIASAVVDQKIAEKEEEHEGYLKVIEQEAALRQCMNEASKELVGLRTASLEIVKATQKMGSTVLRFTNLQSELSSAVTSGLAALADSQGPRTFAGAYWLDEALEDAERNMRLARRVTYLAALALEYERQESNADGFRQRIIAAKTPSELEAVRQDMLASTANRQIGSGTVGDAFAVVSLRDDILALADHSEAADGLSVLSPVDRFRVQLTDPQYSVYRDGEFLGQRIPFELVPPGLFGVGPSGDLFSANQCAERLWSVNVGIVGADGVSGNATFSRVEVLKHNTFFSQWCSPSAQAQPFQVAGIQPSENLFLDPYTNGSFLDVPRSDPSSYSRAVLSNVRTDVERSDVERGEYAQGAQSGFAGRSLFGQYALFFPADSLRYTCAEGASCGSQSGNALDLSLVEDVLIRFDYVAGAKP